MIQKTHPISRWKQWLALPLLGVLLVAVACEKAAPPAAPVASSASAAAQIAPPPPPSLVQPNGAAIPPPPPPKLYTYVEHMPQLPGGGGNKSIVEFIQKHLAYPAVAAADQRTGMVFVSFIVDEKGQVQAPEIVKGLSASYDAAVLAAVRQLPRFEPGMQDGKQVDVSFTVPIRFANAATSSK